MNNDMGNTPPPQNPFPTGQPMPPGGYQQPPPPNHYQQQPPPGFHPQGFHPQQAGPYGPQQPQGPGDARPWFKKKRWWAAGVAGLVLVGAALGGEGSTDDETTTAGESSQSSEQEQADAPERERAGQRGNGQRNGNAQQEAPEEAAQAAEPEAPAPDVTQVQAGELLEAFEGNEAAADAQYAGKTLEVTGNVYKVDTEFLDEDQYVVMLDNGEAFSILTVNCNDVSADQAASIAVDSEATLRGTFDDGGDLGVELSDCELL